MNTYYFKKKKSFFDRTRFRYVDCESSPNNIINL